MIRVDGGSPSTAPSTSPSGSGSGRPGPRGANGQPGVRVQPPTTSTTTPSSGPTTTTPGSTGSSPRPPAYMRYPVTYRPPVGGTADNQARQIPNLPLVYRAQTSGDLREAYWNDPDSRAIIQAAARVYYRDYPNYSDQWAEGFWQEDIINASLNPGSPPPWQALQMIFSGQSTASGSPDGSPSSSSYYSGGYSGGGYSGGGYGGSGSGGQVALTDPTSARGLLMQTMQGVLGRNPSEQEYKQFIKALNQAEMGAPRTVDVEGDLVVQSGGIDPGMVAMEYVQGLEEFESAEGQRAFSAFMQVLGA